MQIAIVIAIYNRADELRELLLSLYSQTDRDFEVVVVDDGSEVDLQSVVKDFVSLKIQYFKKANSGPGLSRNFGVKKTNADWAIFLDSDVILPENYIENVKKNILNIPCDAFGGADLAHKRFNPLQQAISYSMTSVFTTGGIRGSASSVSKFQPRSFNMGVKRAAFEALGGFSRMRIGEDPDLSMRFWEAGYTTAFFPNIAVYHKRRNSLSSFSRQVYQFGCARPILNQRHPNYVKLTFAFPSLFLLGYIGSVILYYSVKLSWPLALYGLYSLLLSFHALWKTKNFSVASMSVLMAYVQLFSYGYGFLKSWILLNVFRIPAEKAFPKHFHQY